MIKANVFKIFFLCAFFVAMSSCGKKAEQVLIAKLIPKDTLVLEVPAAYSCNQIVAGIRTIDGLVAPEVQGPLIQFNRMTLTWTKKGIPLHLHSAKLKITGGGISGGETTCDITIQLQSLFEAPAANNSSTYRGGEFLSNGTITSNPNCRIPCSIPLIDPERPEIVATGELIIKASEVANSGTDEEIWHRVKSSFRFTIKP